MLQPPALILSSRVPWTRICTSLRCGGSRLKLEVHGLHGVGSTYSVLKAEDVLVCRIQVSMTEPFGLLGCLLR